MCKKCLNMCLNMSCVKLECYIKKEKIYTLHIKFQLSSHHLHSGKIIVVNNIGFCVHVCDTLACLLSLNYSRNGRIICKWICSLLHNVLFILIV